MSDKTPEEIGNEIVMSWSEDYPETSSPKSLLFSQRQDLISRISFAIAHERANGMKAVLDRWPSQNSLREWQQGVMEFNGYKPSANDTSEWIKLMLLQKMQV